MKRHHRKPMGKIKYRLDYDPRYEIRLIIGAGAEVKPIIEREWRYSDKGGYHLLPFKLIRATLGPYPGTLEAIYRRVN